MTCPDCGAAMEYEYCPQVVPSSLADYDRTGKEVHTIPAGHYYCSECDSEWTWVFLKKLRKIDGAEFSREENSIYDNSRRHQLG